MSSSSRLIASRYANGGEISEVIFKLQALLPERNRRHLRRVSRNEDILKEVCSYIKKLHKEVNGMSETLSQLLASLDHNNVVEADVLTALLQH